MNAAHAPIDDAPIDDAPTGRCPDPAAVLAAFGLTGTVTGFERVSGAWSHRVYRLTTTDGGEYAVKQFMNPWSQPKWREWLAQAWTLELAAWDAGVAMPRPIPAATGECIADVEASTGDTVPVRVHRWVRGRPCPPVAVSLDIARQIGRDLARTHSLGVQPTRTEAFPKPSRDAVDAWPDLIDRVAPVAGELAADLDATRPWVRELGELFDESAAATGEPVFSHGDVDQKNLILPESGPAAGPPAVLCDWDVAAPWPAEAELARTAMAMADWSQPEVARAVVRAYREAGGPATRDLQPTDLAVDLVVGLDWLVFCIERATGLRPAEEQRRRESRQQITSEMTQLPSNLRLAQQVQTWLSESAG